MEVRAGNGSLRPVRYVVFMIDHEAILIETARTLRELEAQVVRRLAARQLGEAWEGLGEGQSGQRSGQEQARAA